MMTSYEYFEVDDKYSKLQNDLFKDKDDLKNIINNIDINESCKYDQDFCRIQNLKSNHQKMNPLFFPLPIYLVFKMIRIFGNIFLNNKFKKYVDEHGLGLGVIPYTNFISYFEKKLVENLSNYDHIILIELPGISGNKLSHQYPTSENIVNSIN